MVVMGHTEPELRSVVHHRVVQNLEAGTLSAVGTMIEHPFSMEFGGPS